MKATKLVSIIKKSELDTKLSNYKEICESIKALESQKESLRNALIKSYFESNPTYTSKDKLIIASYMPQDRTCFDSKHFKEVNPALYDEFSYTQTVHIFTVK